MPMQAYVNEMLLSLALLAFPFPRPHSPLRLTLVSQSVGRRGQLSFPTAISSRDKLTCGRGHQ